ncbi:MAG: hypothetical protein AABW75_02525 [Nanoarchaeota archaeon]
MNKENNAILVIVITLVVFLVLGGFGMMGFGNYGGMYGMMNGFYGGFGFMWIFGWLIMILVLIALVLFIMWLIKQLTGDERRRK